MEYTGNVSIGKIRKVQSPQIIRAGLVNPVIAIGIYDKLSQSGYVSRNYAGDQRLLKNTMDLALNDFSDKTKLKIVIAGANKSNKFFGNERKRLTNRLSTDTWNDIGHIVNGYGFNESQIEFHNEKTGLVFDMYLDCKNGQIVIEEAKDITPYLNKRIK